MSHMYLHNHICLSVCPDLGSSGHASGSSCQALNRKTGLHMTWEVMTGLKEKMSCCFSEKSDDLGFAPNELRSVLAL